MTVYDGKIYYTYEDNDEGYLDEVGIGITKEWVFYVSSNGTNHPTLNRLKKYENCGVKEGSRR